VRFPAKATPVRRRKCEHVWNPEHSPVHQNRGGLSSRESGGTGRIVVVCRHQSFVASAAEMIGAFRYFATVELK
jgi:hypothetical protein